MKSPNPTEQTALLSTPPHLFQGSGTDEDQTDRDDVFWSGKPEKGGINSRVKDSSDNQYFVSIYLQGKDDACFFLS